GGVTRGGPGIARDHRPIRDQDEEPHRQRRQQAGELEAEAARREPAPQKIELRAQSPPQLKDGPQIGALLHLRNDLASVLGLAEEAEREEERDTDAHHDREDEEAGPDRLGDGVEALGGEVPDEDQARRPKARAEDAERGELAVAHIAAAG